MKDQLKKWKEKAANAWSSNKVEIVTYSIVYGVCFFAGAALGRWAFEQGAEYGEQMAIDRTNALLDDGILLWSDAFEKNIENGDEVDLSFGKDGVVVTVTKEIDING